MTDEELAAIEARVKATTPGNPEWSAYIPHGDERWIVDNGIRQGFLISDNFGIDRNRYSRANAEFVAHAHEDVPLLIAEVRRLRLALAESTATSLWEVQRAGEGEEDRGRLSAAFNDSVGVFGYISVNGPTGANHHPGRCTCQGDDPTPHKHYREPPYSCARCNECKAFTPLSRPAPP